MARGVSQLWVAQSRKRLLSPLPLPLLPLPLPLPLEALG